MKPFTQCRINKLSTFYIFYLEQSPRMCYNNRETKFDLVVRHIRLSSKLVVNLFQLLAISADTPQKPLVVKHPDLYYDFTTNDDRDMRIYAEFCRSRPILSKWV